MLCPRHELISQSCSEYNTSILSFAYQSATNSIVCSTAVESSYNFCFFLCVRLVICCLFVWWLQSLLFRVLIQRILRALCRWNCVCLRFLCVATVACCCTFFIVIPVSFELFELEHFDIFFVSNSTWIYGVYFHIVFVSDVAYILRLVLGWRRRQLVVSAPFVDAQYKHLFQITKSYVPIK